jgi:hypothetical protein
VIFAVLATGPSMSQAIADQVRGRCRAVAVNDAFRLAPWADALVGNDRRWWNTYPEALAFEGRKYCAFQLKGCELLKPMPAFPAGTNSGLQGCRVASMLGATKILLLGFDLSGSHYFGPHPKPLKNTTPARFKEFIRQFSGWKGAPIVNCTPGSALTRFPFSTLEEELRIDGERVRATGS